MTGQEVEVIDLPRQAQRALVFWRTNPMLPVSYIDSRTGEIDLAGMERAAWLLTRLGVDPWDALGDTFNIKGNIGFKADLQRTLLALVPGYDFELLEVDDEHATARLKTPTGWKPPITKRITDTDIQHYKKQQPDDAEKNNYMTKPNRMLEARVTTELIDLYAKGVIRGLVRAEAGERAGWYSDQGEEPVSELGSGTGEEASTESSSRMVPARSVAPDGTTIPEYLREPEVDADVRADLLARIGDLDDDARADLHEVCSALKIPNVRTVRHTRAHGALLARLIGEAVARHAPAPPAEDPSWVPAQHIPVDDDGDPYDDEGRPF
jgi:hypothetical protein